MKDSAARTNRKFFKLGSALGDSDKHNVRRRQPRGESARKCHDLISELALKCRSQSACTSNNNPQNCRPSANLQTHK